MTHTNFATITGKPEGPYVFYQNETLPYLTFQILTKGKRLVDGVMRSAPEAMNCIVWGQTAHELRFSLYEHSLVTVKGPFLTRVIDNQPHDNNENCTFVRVDHFGIGDDTTESCCLNDDASDKRDLEGHALIKAFPLPYYFVDWLALYPPTDI